MEEHNSEARGEGAVVMANVRGTAGLQLKRVTINDSIRHGVLAGMELN
jgi:hypothetical protein